MREIFEKGIDWDDYLNADVTNKWNAVCREINDVTVKIPRVLISKSPSVYTSENEVRGDLGAQEATLPTNCTETEVRSSSNTQRERMRHLCTSKVTL